MRDMQDDSERLATLIDLLNGMGSLEIWATIRHVNVKHGSDESRLMVHLTGRDIPLLTANNGRVLEAIEILAGDILGLSGAERDAIQFDAGDFLAEQEVRLRRAADSAVGRVRFTGKPFVFPPMSGRDRKLLGHALVTYGLYFETLGEQTTRWVVLFPKDVRPDLTSAGAWYLGGD